MIVTTSPAHEASLNRTVPGARILRYSETKPIRDPFRAADAKLYPLSEVNDLAYFAHLEMAGTAEASPISHPDVILYVYVLGGAGTLHLGEGSEVFAEEVYDFAAEDLLIVPRGVPYRLTGTWSGIAFHGRTSVYGSRSGTVRLPYALVQHGSEGSRRYCFDSLLTRGIVVPADPETRYYDPSSGEFVAAPSGMHEDDLLRGRVTPIDEQSADRGNNEMARRNPSVLGARILKRGDAPDVYNANGGHSHWAYPLSWTDDMAIFIPHHHLSVSDVDRPGDSHAHPEIEEYRYIVSGSGTCTFGEGDETFADEVYEFTQGDLVVTPRNVPHLDAGDYVAIAFHMKRSAFGVTPGTAQYPHPAYVYTRPPRPTPEEQAAINDPGTYIIMDSRETTNVYQPNPISYIERNPTDLTYLREDLFPVPRSAETGH